MESDRKIDFDISTPDDKPKHWWNKPIEFELGFYIWVTLFLLSIIIAVAKDFLNFIAQHF